MLAAQSIKAGDNKVVMAGGFESMSRAPHLSHIRAGVKFGPGDMVDHMQHDGLTCAFEEWAMGCAADHIAEKHNITREAQDQFSAQSHLRAAAAQEAGYFDAEMIKLDGGRLKQKFDVSADEGVRADSSAESLSRLRAAFGKDGTVTAGNASQISDGAAALIVASEEAANEIGAEPMARIVGYNTVGVEPKEIFSAPAAGMAKLLKDHGLTVGDIDLFEINEAFAAQAMANATELGVPQEKLNICGGGVALGHPIGASGARVLTTLVHQMVRTDSKKGVVSLCLGGGNAVSMLIER
jgi:acetyl-CoA C-acetyltransferase